MSVNSVETYLDVEDTGLLGSSPQTLLAEGVDLWSKTECQQESIPFDPIQIAIAEQRQAGREKFGIFSIDGSVPMDRLIGSRVSS